MNAVDTNVFVYALDQQEPAKQRTADRLVLRLTSAPAVTVVLWQVVVEFLATLRRWESKGRIAATDA